METITPPLADRLRRALDDAETDVQDIGHTWLAGDQLVGAAALRLIARDPALLADLAAAPAASGPTSTPPDGRHRIHGGHHPTGPAQGGGLVPRGRGARPRRLRLAVG